MSKPLSLHSYAMVITARDRLTEVGQLCEQLTPNWMAHPLYKQAVKEYDIVMDAVPEWAEVRRRAKENGDGLGTE